LYNGDSEAAPADVQEDALLQLKKPPRITIICASTTRVFTVSPSESHVDKLARIRTHFNKGKDWILRESVEAESEISEIEDNQKYVLIHKDTKPLKFNAPAPTIVTLKWRGRDHIFKREPFFHTTIELEDQIATRFGQCDFLVEDEDGNRPKYPIKDVQYRIRGGVTRQEISLCYYGVQRWKDFIRTDRPQDVWDNVRSVTKGPVEIWTNGGK
jgi:hypothetical protein